MTNKFLKLVLTCFVMLTIASCESEMPEASVAPEKKPSVAKEIIYIYQNKEYRVRFVEEGGKVNLLEGEDNGLAKNAYEKAQAYFVDPRQENILYLFDTEEERGRFLKSKNPKKVSAANAGARLGYSVIFYEHDNLNGWKLMPNKLSSPDVREFNNSWTHCGSTFCPSEVNDRFSSLTFTAPYINLYTEFNYKGKSLKIQGYAAGLGAIDVISLSAYRYGGIWNTKYNFNDKVSSYSLTDY